MRVGNGKDGERRRRFALSVVSGIEVYSFLVIRETISGQDALVRPVLHPGA